MHSSTCRGVVKGIMEDYEDPALVRLEVEKAGPKPKAKKGELRPRASFTVSAESTRGLAVGDRVKVEIMVHKVREVKRKNGNPTKADY